MTLRTLALVLVTVWLTGTLIMTFVATQNFRTVDRILERPTPQAASKLAELDHDSMRMLLRHLSSELNRLYFMSWNAIQLLLAVVVLAMMVRAGSRLETWLALAMLLIVVALLGGTFRIIELGRTIDFVSRNPPPPEVVRFGKLHAAYGAMELVKLVVGVVLGWILGVSRKDAKAQRTQ